MKSALWLLTIVNLFNYIDRYIIASVAPKIQAEFHLTHAETGMLMSAFMIGYMLTSPIFGWLGDRNHRPRLMGFGVVAWSLATAASGAVMSFIPLLGSRVAVGIGEASYATISPAYIRDRLKDPRLVNRAMGLFYAAIPIGAAIGYMWGGWIADKYDWRTAFYLGALPGFILGAIVWFMKEPERAMDPTHIKPRNELESFKKLMSIREYRLSVFAYIAYTFGLGGFAAWAPQYGVDVLHVSLSESSFKIGAVTSVAGIVGTLIGGKWGDVFVTGARKDGLIAAQGCNKFCAFAALIATPFAFWAIHIESMNGFMLTMLCVQIALFAATAPITTGVLAAVPAQVAASAFAIQIFFIHAFGDLISPPIVGWLTDRMPMSDAMNILAAAIGLSAIVWWRAGQPLKDQVQTTT